MWDGEIYAGIETFDDGRGENIQVAVYDANTLKWKRSIDWEPSSGQVEVCGLAVDRDGDMVGMADWGDGRYVYGDNRKTGRYVRKVHLRPVPQWQQGIFMVGGRMLISADDGDADLDEPDNLYVADLRDGKSYATVLPFRLMADFRRPGEIEGLAVDPATDDLLVLANRGARIVLGMPRGFYPGYDGEVHEVYVFEKDTEEIIGLANQAKVYRRVEMFCDSAEPDRIKTWQKAGFRAYPVKKEPGSVKAQIDWLKGRKIHIHPSCVNVLKEVQQWMWKKDPTTGLYIDEPVEFMDDAMAALRYSVERLRRGSAIEVLK